MANEVRLQKVIAQGGLASRREAERLIESGRVSVNNQTVTTQGQKVDPERDQVRVDGKLVKLALEKIYLAMHKPRSVVSTAYDPLGRKTVVELLKGIASTRGSKRVFHVGRLDYNSEGLLLFTNDGRLANALTHPSSQVPRVYRARVQGSPTAARLRSLLKGVRLEDGIARVVEIEVFRRNRSSTWVELIVGEGRNRLVRRLFSALGHSVLRLIRVSYGGVELGDLRPGQVRQLSAQEVDLLREWQGKRK